MGERFSSEISELTRDVSPETRAQLSIACSARSSLAGSSAAVLRKARTRAAGRPRRSRRGCLWPDRPRAAPPARSGARACASRGARVRRSGAPPGGALVTLAPFPHLIEPVDRLLQRLLPLLLEAPQLGGVALQRVPGVARLPSRAAEVPGNLAGQRLVAVRRLAAPHAVEGGCGAIHRARVLLEPVGELVVVVSRALQGVRVTRRDRHSGL